MTSTQDLQLILYEALGEPIGLLISTSDPERARQALYRARTLAGDPALQRLQIRLSPIEGGDIIITKGPSEWPTNGAGLSSDILDL